MTHSYFSTWLIHTCDMTYSHMWHDSFICVTLLNAFTLQTRPTWKESCPNVILHTYQHDHFTLGHDSFQDIFTLGHDSLHDEFTLGNNSSHDLMHSLVKGAHLQCIRSQIDSPQEAHVSTCLVRIGTWLIPGLIHVGTWFITWLIHIGTWLIPRLDTFTPQRRPTCNASSFHRRPTYQHDLFKLNHESQKDLFSLGPDSFHDLMHSLFKRMPTCRVFMNRIWRIHMCDSTHFLCATWLIHVCDMTHLNVRHDSFKCAT